MPSDRTLRDPLHPDAVAFTKGLFARCRAAIQLGRAGDDVSAEKAAIEAEAARLHPNLGDQVRERAKGIRTRHEKSTQKE